MSLTYAMRLVVLEISFAIEDTSILLAFGFAFNGALIIFVFIAIVITLHQSWTEIDLDLFPT